MALVLRHSLPRFVKRGVTTTLDADVYSADGVQQTASAGTITVLDGGSTIVDEAAVTTGPPATYSLLGSATSGRAFSTQWLEVWTLTIGGASYTFRRPVYIVRELLYPTITDTDLTDRYADLVNLLPSGTTDFSEYREAAWGSILREFLKRGKVPPRILSAYALTDMHIHRTLDYIFGDLAMSVGDGRYRELQADHRAQYQREWETMTYDYDADESGTVDDGEQDQPASPVIWLSQPRRSRAY